MRLYRILLVPVLASVAAGQFVQNLPQCWQYCFSNSGSLNCNAADIPCICRASNGNFLTDVITCAKSRCDNYLDANLLLTPLQLACNLAGTPIAPAALRNAQNVATEASEPQTVTMTMTAGGQPGSIIEVTTSQRITATVETTLTVTTTDNQGQTYYIIEPVTLAPSTIFYGSPTTVSATETQMRTVTVTAQPGSSGSSQSTSASSGASSRNPAVVTVTVTPSAQSSGSQTSATQTGTSGASQASATATGIEGGSGGGGGSPFGSGSVVELSWLTVLASLFAGVLVRGWM